MTGLLATWTAWLRRSPAWTRALATAGVALLGAQVGVYLIVPAGHLEELLSQAIYVPVLGLMLVGLWAAVRNTAPDKRPGWRVLLAAGVLLTLAEITWGGILLGGPEPAGLSVADPIWLAVYPVWMVGLYLLDRNLPRRGDRAIGLLDLLIVMAAFAVIIWELVARPLLSEGGDPLDVAVTLAYPVFDLGVLLLVIQPAYRYEMRLDASRLLLAIGFLSFVAADVLWLVGNPVFDIWYVIATLALAIAGLAAASEQAGPEPAVAAQTSWLTDAVTYAVAGAVVLNAAWQELAGDISAGMVVGTVAVLSLVLVRLALTQRENRRLLRQTEEMALTDPLTGLRNRGYFQDRLASEIARARRNGALLGLLIADVDRFKQVNDSAGHPAGDEVLRKVAAVLRSACRPSDTPCRIGGDELAVIVPDISMTDIERLGGRVVEAVRSLDLTAEGVEGGLTVSVGAALFPDQASGPAPLVDRADQALYDAKRSGRGQLRVYRAHRDGRPAAGQVQVGFA